MKQFLVILVLAMSLPGSGFSTEPVGPETNARLNGDEPKTGYIDEQGRKQGFFIIFGKDRPEMGYPTEGRIEEGWYKDDRKHGEWIMYHPDGITPRLKGTYADGRPSGPYEKINSEGTVVEKSSFKNGKQLGDFELYYDDGTVFQKKSFNAEGKEHGQTTIYYNTGQVQYSYTKVNGVMTGEAIRYWEDGSIKEITMHAEDGSVISTTVVNPEPPVTEKVETGSGGPDGSGGHSKDGKVFACNGYNKVYNDAEELWMDGTFKNCKLWEGKLYKYDADGILLKFEVWKNGIYHSDGQLKD